MLAKKFSPLHLFFTIFSTVELEVRKHILSVIVMSTKSVIMTDNVVMFCVSEVVPTRSWGGHKISNILNRGGRKILHPFYRGGQKISRLKFAQVLRTPLPLFRLCPLSNASVCWSCPQVKDSGIDVFD